MPIRTEDAWSKASPNVGRIGNRAWRVDFEGRSKTDGWVKNMEVDLSRAFWPK